MNSRKYSKLLIYLFILISINGYSKNLDELINEYKNNSYTTKINEKSLEEYDIKEKLYKNGDWNEVKLTSDSSYEAKKNIKDGFSVSNEVSYGLLYYKNTYDITNDEFTENQIGISKSLNDFFYSDKKYNLETNSISRKIQEISNETTSNEEIRNLIDLYKNYKNKEKEIEQTKLSLESKIRDLDVVGKKFNLGVSSKFDYDLAKYEYESTVLSLDNLEKELDIYAKQFLLYNVVIPNNEKLDDLVVKQLQKEDFYTLRASEMESIQLNQELKNMELSKETFDYKYPVFAASTGYDFENEGAFVGLSMTKTFKITNDTLDILKSENEKLQLEYEQKKNELISNVGEQMVTYTTYQTNEINASKKVDITKSEYEIYLKKYELGSETFSNYVEKRNTYYQAVIDYEVAKNELAAFTKKIQYYK